MKKYILLSLIFVLACTKLISQTNPDDVHWSSDFAIPTTDEVRALLIDGDYAYYNEFGRLVRWNISTNEYEILGVSASGSIYAIIKHDGDIYIGGNFERIGGTSASFLAKWNNGVWDTVASGLNGKVSAICFDKDDNLWIGGLFTAINGFESNYIACRKNNVWEKVDGFNAQVRSIVRYQSKIYAGGDFNLYDSTQSGYSLVAMYDGNTWSNAGYLSSNSGGKVISMSVSVEGFIVAGGIFENDGADTISPNIAYYDGAKWNSLGAGLDGMVLAVEAGGDKFYAGGYFDSSGGNECKSIAEFSGNEWTEIDGGISGTDYPSILCMDESENSLYVGGNFSKAGNIDCWNTAYLKGGSWQNFLPETRNGTISSVGCLTVDKSNDMLYAGGGFVKTGKVVSYGISKFDGKEWLGCNSGFTPTSNVCYSIQAVNDTVYFTGWFNYADGIRLRNVAKWIDSRKTWEPVGNGIEGGDGDMGSILVTGDKIYVSGNFRYVMNGTDTLYANYITYWDGQKWNSMGEGIARNNNQRAYVEKFVESPEGNIILVGTFDFAGGQSVTNYTVWNPSSKVWMTNNMYFSGSVYTLLIDGDNYYFGGAFKDAGPLKNVNSLVRWNSKANTWSTCDSGVAGSVNAMVKWGPDIYLAGRFTTASGKTCNSVAKYDITGDVISPLGSGLIYGVNYGSSHGIANVSDLIVYKNELYFGGMFTSAGNKKSSSNMAKWTLAPLDVAQNRIEFEINISPNPASEYIEISVGAQGAVPDKVSIFDILGIEVLKGMDSRFRGNDSHFLEENFRIDISSLSPGVYFVRVGDMVKKFVKI